MFRSENALAHAFLDFRKNHTYTTIIYCKKLSPSISNYAWSITKISLVLYLTILLVNRNIIFNKFDKHIQLHMIMICTGALSGQGPHS